MRRNDAFLPLPLQAQTPTLTLTLMLTLMLFLILLPACSDEDNTVPINPPPPPGQDDLQQQGVTFWWNDTVFYEVFVRSFYDSDGDGIGDLQGLIEKLDYLNDGDPGTETDLGVSGIWLMPVTQSPSYHGYDVTDYRTIEEDYGTNPIFQQLMTEAHARGIKVIVDYVMNHSSNQNPWFLGAVSGPQNPYRDWYRWSSGNPGYLGPWGQTVWHWSATSYYYGLFWGGMPDLNYTEPAVKDEMWDIARFWLEDLGVDGFRLDAVKFIIEDGSMLENVPETFTFWEEFQQYYKSIAPDAFAVGEAWDSTDIVLQYLESGFDNCFEFELATTILGAANSGNPGSLKSKIWDIASRFPYQQYATFLTNHDQNRSYETLGRNLDKVKLAAAICLTLPGTPFLYYGEEIAMLGRKPDEDIRRPMQWNSGANAGFTTGTPWHNLNGNYATFNVEVMDADDGSLLNWYHRLIHIRNDAAALRRGTYQELEANLTGFFAFLRVYDDQAVVVIHNLSGNLGSGYNLSAAVSRLAEGTYTAVNLVDDAAATPLTVAEGGEFSGWSPTGFVNPRGTVIIQLTGN